MMMMMIVGRKCVRVSYIRHPRRRRRHCHLNRHATRYKISKDHIQRGGGRETDVKARYDQIKKFWMTKKKVKIFLFIF